MLISFLSLLLSNQSMKNYFFSSFFTLIFYSIKLKNNNNCFSFSFLPFFFLPYEAQHWGIRIVPFKGFGPHSCHLPFHHCWGCYHCRSSSWSNRLGIKILDHSQIYLSIIAIFCNALSQFHIQTVSTFKFPTNVGLRIPTFLPVSLVFLIIFFRRTTKSKRELTYKSIRKK